MLGGFQLLDSGVLCPFAEILTFDPGATIDQNAKTINLVVPYGTDLETFAPGMILFFPVRRKDLDCGLKPPASLKYVMDGVFRAGNLEYPWPFRYP